MINLGLDIASSNQSRAWWQQEYPDAVLVLDFENDRAMLDGQETSIENVVSINRASPGYATRADGTLAYFGPNELRRTDLGLLIEPASTNYVRYSNDLSQWNIIGNSPTTPVIETDAALAPDGTMTADKLILNRPDATTFSGIRRLESGLPNDVYRYSVYLKAARPEDVGKVIDLWQFDTSTLPNVKHTSSAVLTNSWTRYFSPIPYIELHNDAEIIFIGYLNNSIQNAALQIGETQVLIWGGQAEQNMMASSNINTLGQHTPRTGDNVSFSYHISEINQFTCYSEFELQNYPKAGSFSYLLDNSIETYRSYIRIDSSGNLECAVFNTTNNLISLSHPFLISLNAKHKIAFSYSLNGANISINGENATRNSTEIIFNPNSSLFHQRLGQNIITKEEQLGGYISKFAIYNKEKNDEELSDITS